MNDLQLKNSLDLTKIDTNKKTYNDRLKAFQTFCNEGNHEVGIESLNLYMQQDSIKSSTKRTTKSAVYKALKIAYKSNPMALRELEENFKEIKTGKKQTIGVNLSECYNENEINDLLKKLASKEVSKKHNTDVLRYKKISLILWTLFNSGLRISELIGIRLDRIHLNGIAKISITGKGNKERTIFLPREKVEEIKSLFNSKVYLFENNSGKKFDRVNLTKLLKIEIESVSNKPFHAHLTRHSFATTQIISKKKSIKSISNYLGHSSTAITQDLYVHDNLEYKDLFEA
jgi:site-specific recombinase XerD